MNSIIGKSINRTDAIGKVKGSALYPGDINMPGQLHMKILFSERPHAVIKEIDTTKALSLEGVVAVFTAADVPVNEYGLGTYDQPVLCGPGSQKQFADRVRFIGDQVAVVVAESEEIAAQGCKLIEAVYEELPAVTNPLEAIKQGSSLVHPERDSNIFCQYKIRKGDWEDAFRKADVIVESTYETPAQEHAYLQPEAGLGYIDDEGRVTVIVAGQWAHEDRQQIAHALNLPEDRVRIIYPAIGGAFGGREDMSVQIVLGLAAWRLSQRGIYRPVKIIWTRAESIRGHHKRHPYHIQAKWGATNEGKIIAAEVKIIADGGAYSYTSPKVLGNATLMCTGPYEIPNVKVDSYAVYTNNLPNGAFRGFGGPQGAFAAENQVNKLAAILGIDPVEIRMRNALEEGSLLSVGTPLPTGVSIKQVIAACARAAGWEQSELGWRRQADSKTEPQERLHIQRGQGFACAFKNVGFSFGALENCWAAIRLEGDKVIEKATLYHAGAEVGQGSQTVFIQMAAESLGIPLEKIHLVASDTAQAENSGSTSASRLTFMAGNSILGAAKEALVKWHDEERPAYGEYVYYPPKTTPLDRETGKSEPNFAYGYVAEAVDLEVDTETGQVWLKKVICADDVGRAINPEQVEGQIEGSVVQAAGYGILENFIQAGGQVLTDTFSTYLIPTVLDIPDRVESIILEVADPIGPFGARGMGEMPFLPLVPAVTAGIHSATGKWLDRFPYTPERVLFELYPDLADSE